MQLRGRNLELLQWRWIGKQNSGLINCFELSHVQLSSSLRLTVLTTIIKRKMWLLSLCIASAGLYFSLIGATPGSVVGWHQNSHWLMMAMVILDTISKRQLLLERQLHGCKESKKYKRCAWQSPREMFPGFSDCCGIVKYWLLPDLCCAVLIFKMTCTGRSFE